MSIKYEELVESINNEVIETDKLFEVTLGGDCKNSPGMKYLNLKYNKNYAIEEAQEEYVPIYKITIDKELPINYSYISHNEHKPTNKHYHSMALSDEDSVKVGKTVDEGIISATSRCAKAILKKDLEDPINKDKISSVNKKFYEVLKDSEDNYKRMVLEEYLNKVTKKVVEAKTIQWSIAFDFKTWPQSFKGCGGKVKTIVRYAKTAEEMAANPAAKAPYRNLIIDENVNFPRDEFKYSSGSFFGDILFPNNFYIKDGAINLKPALGVIYVTPDTNSASGSGSQHDDLVDETYVSEQTNKAASKSKSKSTIDDEDTDEEDSKSKKSKKSAKPDTKKKAKKAESDDEESEEEVKPKKSAKPDTKKKSKNVETSEDEESEEEVKPKKKVDTKKKAAKKVASDNEESDYASD